jgi:hypothetical protein
MARAERIRIVLGAFSDAALAVIITILALELKRSRAAGVRRAREPLADGAKLCGPLPVHCHHLDQSLPPDAICTRAKQSSHQVELPASVFGIARALRHPMGSSHTAELGACRDLGFRIRLCRLRLSCL